MSNYLFKHSITMEISSRNKAQVNKTPYFRWLSTPCLRQQPHEYKNRSTPHPQQTHISSNSSAITADNSTGTYIIHYSMELIAFFVEYTLFNNCNFNLVYRYSLSVKFKSVYYSVTVTRCCTYSCFVLLKMGDSKTRNM
jgi:hypothetical protein